MSEKTTTEKVKEFHELFEHPIGEHPNCLEPLKIRQLRIKLLFEELQELAEAGDVMGTFERLCHKVISDFTADNDQLSVDGDNVDKVEELDALCDLQYVLDGKKLTSGLHTITDQAFALVHYNNMNKAHDDMDHVQQTADKNVWQKDRDYTVTETDRGFLMYNISGKLIKPHDHKKVDLTTLIIKHSKK